MKNLKTYFSKAAKIAGKNKVIPHCSEAFFKDGWLTVSDLECFYSFKSDLFKDLSGKLDFKLFYEAVKNAKFIPEIKVIPNYILVGMTILPISNDQWLVSEAENLESKGSLTQSDIETIQNISVFCGKDELRQAMQGVAINRYARTGEICATNAHYLKTAIISNLEIDGIIPQRYCPLLFAGTCKSNQGHLKIESETESIQIRLIDAKYPDYHAVIPTNNPIKVTFNKKDLLQAIKTLSLTVNKNTDRIDFNFKPDNTCDFHSEDIDFNLETHLSLPYLGEGTDLEISFNWRYLETILKSDSSEEVLIEGSICNRAVLINTYSLLMPVMRVLK